MTNTTKRGTALYYINMVNDDIEFIGTLKECREWISRQPRPTITTYYGKVLPNPAYKIKRYKGE